MNHYLFSYYKEYQPDLMVIGIPGEIVPLASDQKENFSELALVISNAVDVDTGILNIYHTEQVSEEYLETLNALCQRKYNVDIGAYCISDQVLYFNTKEKKYEVQYVKDKHQENVSNINYENENVFSINDKEKAARIFANLMEELEENIRFV